MADAAAASLVSRCCGSFSCFLAACCLGRGGWGDAGGELLLLPAACARTCCGIAYAKLAAPTALQLVRVGQCQPVYLYW